MQPLRCSNHFQVFVSSAIALLFLVTGCAPKGDVAARLDQNVYASIDRSWDPNYGSQANYRVRDAKTSPEDLVIENPISNLGTLTLPQAVALATAHNRLYHDQQDMLYLTGLNLRLTRHQFERRFFGVGRVGYDGNRNDELISAEATAGFNHLLADGTEIGLALTGAWVDVLSGDLRGGLTSILSAAIRKPLLRGSKREIVLEGLTQAERDVLYQVRGFNRYRKQLVVQVITEYYRTLQLLDQAQISQENIEVLSTLYKRSIILYENGQLDQVERDRIHQEVLQARDSTILAWKNYQQALDLFKRTLAVNPSLKFQLDEQELALLKTSPLTKPEFPDEAALDAALARRLDLVNEADRIQDAERKIVVAKDRLRAELNIVGGVKGVSKDVDGQSLQVYEDRARLGLEFDLPFDRVAEENDYRTALLFRSQQQRRYDDTADQVRLEVLQAYRNLVTASERFGLQTEGESLAVERRRVANLLSEYGRTSTRRILEAQSDLVRAQNDRTQALINYAVATLEFYRDTGVLQVKPDGMWEL